MNSEWLEIDEFMNVPAEEAYRELGANLRKMGKEQNNKLIALVSYGPEEGKTTTAVHLAITLAKSGSKVLLIDADLRKPSRFKKLGQTHSEGLWNLEERPDDIIHPTNTPNLYITTSGEVGLNSIELLNSAHFDAYLSHVRESFDTVLFDTSSMGSFVDAALLASKLDGALIIVRAHKTTNKRLLYTKQQLEKFQAKVLGVVLNQVPKAEYANYYLINKSYAYLKKIRRKL